MRSYGELVGALVWFAFSTRPDIRSLPVLSLSRASATTSRIAAYTDTDWEATGTIDAQSEHTSSGSEIGQLVGSR